MALILGTMNHLGLTVSDLKGSEAAFYQPVLSFLGFTKIEDTDAMTLWYSETALWAINLWQADADLAGRPHHRFAPGFQHCAFSADSRGRVDDLHALLQDIGATVLDPPAEYDYMPGYYAVFFADPDGLKFELVHFPIPA